MLSESDFVFVFKKHRKYKKRLPIGEKTTDLRFLFQLLSNLICYNYRSYYIFIEFLVAEKIERNERGK